MSYIQSKKQRLTLEILRQNYREEILKIAAEHGAYNVRIFGSVARGEATAESDVDFLVELESGRNLLDRIGLIQELESLLNCKVDVAKIQNIHPDIREKILGESVIL